MELMNESACEGPSLCDCSRCEEERAEAESPKHQSVATITGRTVHLRKNERSFYSSSLERTFVQVLCGSIGNYLPSKREADCQECLKVLRKEKRDGTA